MSILNTSTPTAIDEILRKADDYFDTWSQLFDSSHFGDIEINNGVVLPRGYHRYTNRFNLWVRARASLLSHAGFNASVYHCADGHDELIVDPTSSDVATRISKLMNHPSAKGWDEIRDNHPIAWKARQGIQAGISNWRDLVQPLLAIMGKEQ